MPTYTAAATGRMQDSSAEACEAQFHTTAVPRQVTSVAASAVAPSEEVLGGMPTLEEFFGDVGHFTDRSRFLELCVVCEKLMVHKVVSYDIGERCSVQDEENGPQY